MASPESHRTGARPSGAGVKGLLAMFEKSSSSPSSSATLSNGSNPANPTSRDQSPAPKPLGKIRTSFVAVTGTSGPILGLQKAPIPASPLSPVIPTAEDAKLASEALDTEITMVENEPKKTDVTGTVNGRQMLDESNLKKHNLENQRGYAIPLKASAPPANTESTPIPAIVSIEPEITVPEKPLDLIPIEKGKEESTKPIEVESKPKPADPKVRPAPMSPTKSTVTSKANRLVPANKPGKSLILPSSKSTTTSPLPSPAFAPKSPVRASATTSSSGPRAKTSAATPSTNSSSTRSRAAAATSTTTTSIPAASKPRSLAPMTEKIKAPVAKKVDAKPTREPTKPPTIRSSAFASTTASAAKLTVDQKVVVTRSRPPSSASARNRSPPDSAGMRRGHSGTNSRPGRKDQRSPQRPQTSVAIRNPNRTSVGSLAAIPGATGGDFLSRMMRPTTASAGKVSDKKPGAMNPPPKRSASVASTSRRRERSLPPSAGRLLKQKTGEKPKLEDASTEIAPQSGEAPPRTSTVKGRVQEVVDSSKETTSAEVTTEVEAIAQESEDGGQSPTTTASSTALTHEGEGKDDVEVSTKE